MHTPGNTYVLCAALCLLSAEVGGVVTHEDLRVPGMVSRVNSVTLVSVFIFLKKVHFFRRNYKN